jgi:multidrug efflux pump subunit AcrA (membrane-fusion protein)
MKTILLWSGPPACHGGIPATVVDLHTRARRQGCRRCRPEARSTLAYGALAIAILFLAGCGGRGPREVSAGAESAPVPVPTLTISTTEVPAMYEATGTVRAATTAVLSSKLMGYVREVKAQAGDRVRSGQPLVVLDSRDLEAAHRQAEAAVNEARGAVPEADSAIAAAKASLDLAKITYARMQDLFKKESISNQEFDEASAKLKMAQANYEMALSKRAQLRAKITQAEQALRSAEIMLGYAVIAAPFSGVVTQKTVEPGNLAAPGAPLMTIEREGAYRMEVAVEESRLPATRIGQPVTVSIDALGRTIDGRITEIVPAVDAASRAFTVKVDLPPLAQLRSGLYGRALFPLGNRPVIAVPEAAVQYRGQLVTVLVADAGVARLRFVTLGRSASGDVEILSGLNPGERIVFPVPANVSDGTKVEVRP